MKVITGQKLILQNSAETRNFVETGKLVLQLCSKLSPAETVVPIYNAVFC